jgi:HK97 gp10 family phage protein
MAVTVEGLDRLNKKLQRMPVVAKATMREALVKGADQIVRAQQILAKSSKRSGNLIESDHWEEGEHLLQLLIQNSAFYARYVEFGTSHSAAEPFFFPGYRLMKKRVKGQIRYSATKAVRKVARGG